MASAEGNDIDMINVKMQTTGITSPNIEISNLSPQNDDDFEDQESVCKTNDYILEIITVFITGC